MLKRILTSLLIVIILGMLILGGLWLISRRQAEKAGQKPLTFREFFTVGYQGKIQAPGVNGELSSDFTPGGTGTGTKGGGTNDVGSSTDGSNVEVSQFTGGTITPTSGDFAGQQSFGRGNSFGGGTIGGGSDFGGGNGIGNTPTTPTGSNPQAPSNPTNTPTTASAPVCTNADTNIAFTQDELDRLAALQKRFDAIASILHSDADVQEELSNHDALALKEARILEYTNYCEAKVPLLADPVLKRKIPTPFWHTNNDSDSYIAGTTPGTIDTNNLASGKAAAERIFRINLW